MRYDIGALRQCRCFKTPDTLIALGKVQQAAEPKIFVRFALGYARVACFKFACRGKEPPSASFKVRTSKFGLSKVRQQVQSSPTELARWFATLPRTWHI